MGEFLELENPDTWQNSGGDGDNENESSPPPPPPPPPPPRRRRGRQSTLQPNAKCRVCELTASGNNFGVATCESCKTFFRRNAKREESKVRCLHQNSCNIAKEYRRSCTSCRLRKCFAVGMKKDLILPEEKLRSRARPTFKKPRYRWCRLPAEVDIGQLMAALTSAVGGKSAAAGTASLLAGVTIKREEVEGEDEEEEEEEEQDDEVEVDDDDDDQATLSVSAGEDDSASQMMAVVEEDVDDNDANIDDVDDLAGAVSPTVQAAAAAAAAALEQQESAMRSFDPRWHADGLHFEATQIYHQLGLCVTDYQLPYEEQCAPTLSSKLFNLEDGFATLENSVRKMIRLIPAMPLLGGLEKTLLGKLVKHRVFGAVQIISVLSYDYDRDAWVVLLEKGGLGQGQGLTEAVLHTKEAITGTFMSLTSKRWLDDRSLYSVADVERIYETLADYYRDMLRLFGGHRKVAALVLLAVYLLEEDTALDLTDAEKTQAGQKPKPKPRRRCTGLQCNVHVGASVVQLDSGQRSLHSAAGT